MLCPTRAVVDATGNRNDGGLAVEVCSSLRMVCDLHSSSVIDIYACTTVCIRTTDYVRPNIFVSKNKQKARPEVRPRDGLGEHIFLCICANIQGTSLINGVDILTLVQKTNVFRRRL